LQCFGNYTPLWNERNKAQHQQYFKQPTGGYQGNDYNQDVKYVLCAAEKTLSEREEFRANL